MIDGNDDDDVLHSDDGEAVFVIDSEEAASWVVERLLRLDDEGARLCAQHARRLKCMAYRRGRLEARFLDELRAWAGAQLEGKKARTLKLPHGDLCFRKVPGRIAVDAKSPELIAWAQEHMPRALEERVVRSIHVNTDAVKAHVEATGEIPEGVEVVEARETFSWKGPK